MLLLQERKTTELEQEGLLVGIIDLFTYPASFQQGLLPGVCVWCIKSMKCAP